MLSVTLLGDAQLEHLKAVDALWARYGALLRAREGVTGGMQWKMVSGREYLSRYWPDPATGKKVARSLGPRSAETERTYKEFMAKREDILSELRALQTKVDTAGTIARALRLGRVPPQTAFLLRSLWVASAFDEKHGLAVASVEALCAFERNAGVLLPPRLIQNDGPLRFVMATDSFSTDAMELLANLPWAPRRSRLDVTEADAGLCVVAVDGQVIAEVFSTLSLQCRLEQAHVDREVLGALGDAFSRQMPETIVIGRDASLVPVCALAPAAFIVFQALIPHRSQTAMRLGDEGARAAAEICRLFPDQVIPLDALAVAESLRRYQSAE